MASELKEERPESLPFYVHQKMPCFGRGNTHRNVLQHFNHLFKKDTSRDSITEIIDYFARIATEIIQIRFHHGCLRHEKDQPLKKIDVSTATNCKECTARMWHVATDAVDTLLFHINKFRDANPEDKIFQWNLYGGPKPPTSNINIPEPPLCCVNLFPYDEDADETPEQKATFHQPNATVVESPRTQRKSQRKTQRKSTKRDPSPTPSQGSNSSRSTSRSNSLGSISATPCTPKTKKKATRSPPSRRRYDPNPPSLIFTKVRDQRLLGARRSHFKNAWEDALETAFGNDIPDKMSFENIDEIVSRHSAITVSFLERPKQPTLKTLVRKLRKLPWGQANLFVPNYRHESPWQPTQPPQQPNSFSWNEPRPVRNAWTQQPSPINKLNFSSPPDRHQQRTPINDFARRSFHPPPYHSHFGSPQQQQYHHDQRLQWRIANLESKLDELLKRLSYA